MEMNVLEHIGLSKGESEIYVALLKLGESLVSKVAQETGYHRTNIYDILEKLREKGLAGYVIKENRKYFFASKPAKLLNYLSELMDELKINMPELNQLVNQPRSESMVEVFKGKEGLKTVLCDILDTKKDYLVLEEQGYIQKVLPHFYPQFNIRMNRARIKVKIMTKNSNSIAKRSLMAIRNLPSFISFPSATAIYGDKVAIFIWDEPYHAILIRSKQVADSYRQFFQMLWSNSA